MDDRAAEGRAAALGLTPSGVSKLVSRLEERLGVRLLHRTTRRLALTSKGDVCFPRAHRILGDIEAIETEVAGLRAVPRGHLRLGTSNGFAVHQLAAVLPAFPARYPEIRLALTATDRVVDLVAAQADVTIRAGPITDMARAARDLGADDRTICAAPPYPERFGTPRTPAELANHACIVFSAPTPRRWPLRGGDGVVRAEIAASAVTDGSDTVLQLALDDFGIARLGDIMVGAPIRQGRLVPLLAGVHHAEPVPVAALCLAGRRRLPKVEVFLDFLVARFTHAPWRRT